VAVQKFAVTPGFGVGGTIFKPAQLELLGSTVGEDAEIEMTTFKQLYVAVQEEKLQEVQQKLKQAGLEIWPAGFFTKSLITCNFCRGAEDAGLTVAEALDQAIAGYPVPSPLKIGYAGCALGTSEPLLKDIAVVKMKVKFDLFVGGEAKGLKAKLAQLLVSGLKEEQLIPAVKRLITDFQQNGKKKESYARYVERMTMEKLKHIVGSIL